MESLGDYASDVIKSVLKNRKRRKTFGFASFSGDNLLYSIVMAYYNKIGVLILNETATKFLVCEKFPQNVTSDYIMPGGQFTEENIDLCIKNELFEELGVKADSREKVLIGEYTDVAAGRPNRDVTIWLYSNIKLTGTAQPHTEIKALHGIGRQDVANIKVSPIIRNQIIPDLVQRGILK